MVKIVILDGSVMWMNERLIAKIIPNNDNTCTLFHFNDTKMLIKDFKLPYKY